MDSWQLQIERRKAELRDLKFRRRHPVLTAVLALCGAAIVIVGLVLAWRAFHP